MFDTIDKVVVSSEIYQEIDRIVKDAFFYAKESKYASARGKSVGVAKLKDESRSMYSISDTLSGVLGGF